MDVSMCSIYLCPGKKEMQLSDRKLFILPNYVTRERISRSVSLYSSRVKCASSFAFSYTPHSRKEKNGGNNRKQMKIYCGKEKSLGYLHFLKPVSLPSTNSPQTHLSLRRKKK